MLTALQNFDMRKRENSHIESRVGIQRIRPQPQQSITVGPELLVMTAEIFFDQRKREDVGSGGKWSVRRENRSAAYFGDRVFERRSLLDQHARSFQKRESRMAFVDMHRGGLDAQRPQHVHTADAQHDFLAQALLGVGRVQTMGNRAIPGLIGIELGIEQINRNPADVRSPNEHVDGRVEKRHTNLQRLVVLVAHQRDRIVRPVQHRFVVFLPAIVANSLRQVAPRINQPHRHDRNRQVAALLDVIAGQDPQAARI